jgi:hypothetical protein
MAKQLVVIIGALVISALLMKQHLSDSIIDISQSERQFNAVRHRLQTDVRNAGYGCVPPVTAANPVFVRTQGDFNNSKRVGDHRERGGAPEIVTYRCRDRKLLRQGEIIAQNLAECYIRYELSNGRIVYEVQNLHELAYIRLNYIDARDRSAYLIIAEVR